MTSCLNQTLAQEPGKAWCRSKWLAHNGPVDLAYCESCRYAGVPNAAYDELVENLRLKVRPVDNGPGTELKALIEELGLDAARGCGCAAMARRMDRWGISECKARRDEVARYLRTKVGGVAPPALVKAALRFAWRHGLASCTDPFGTLVDEAIRRAEEKERPKMGERFTWAVGITTVPSRRDGLLPRTLASLRAGGFSDPHLFVDGTDDLQGWVDRFGLDVTCRRTPARTAGNWTLALHELTIRWPAATRYAVFQDDLVCVRDLRQYLEACPWVPNSYLNLMTFMDNEAVIAGKPQATWHEASRVNPTKQQQTGRSAMGLVFDKAAAVALLTRESFVRRPESVDRGWRRIDGGVVDAMNAAGFREWVHCPSLLQHTGDVSSMGNRPQKKALTFPGEGFSALDWLNKKQKARIAEVEAQPKKPSKAELRERVIELGVKAEAEMQALGFDERSSGYVRHLVNRGELLPNAPAQVLAYMDGETVRAWQEAEREYVSR